MRIYDNDATTRRVARRDANRARGLRPADERSGYIVTEVSTSSYRIEGETVPAHSWRVVLQSPWPVDGVGAAVAQQLVTDDLSRILTGLGVTDHLTGQQGYPADRWYGDDARAIQRAASGAYGYDDDGTWGPQPAVSALLDIGLRGSMRPPYMWDVILYITAPPVILPDLQAPRRGDISTLPPELM